jgi:hypothetical protein
MALTKVKLIADSIISDVHVGTLTTDALTEGSKLFYTDARVSSYLAANNFATTGAGYFYNATLSANILTFDKSDGTTDSVDLSLYLDDTNLARLVSGTLDALTGVATFTRDDSSTFTIDFSAFLSDANDYVSSGSFSTSTGVLTLTRLGGATVTVDLDGKYADSVHTHVWTDITDRPTALSSFTNDSGFLTSFTETDPIYTASSWYATTNNAGNWNTAYGWGNHASVGYLTSFTETDPTVPSHVKSITTTNISNWNTAYGWGNHAGLYSLLGHTHNYLYSAPTQLTSTNLNDLSTSGVYFAHDQYGTNTSLPVANYFTMLNIMNGSGRQAQLFFGDTPGSAYWRPRQGDTTSWHGWENLITSVNIGSQSVSYATSAGSVAWSNVSSKPGNIMYYQGFTLDANTMDTNSTGFTYAVNAPYVGPIARFSTGGGYDLWLNSPYSGNGYGLAFRTRNGDSATLNSWQYPAVYNVNANGGGSLYSTAIYDSDNTGFLIDLTSSGNSIRMYGSVNAASHNKPGLLLNASGTDSTGAAFGMQQVTGEGWTGIFVDYEPYTGWGLYHDNPNNYFCITSESSTGQIRSFSVPSRESGNRTAYEKIRLDQNNGNIIVGGSGSAQGDFRAPIFYDYDNTGYYVDPNGRTNINTLTVNGSTNYFYGITYFETNNGGYCGSTDSAKLQAYSYSNNSAFMSFHKGGHYAVNMGLDADNVMRIGGWSAAASRWELDMSGNNWVPGSFRAPIFYDRDNTNYYLNPQCTSEVNRIVYKGSNNQYDGDYVEVSPYGFNTCNPYGESVCGGGANIGIYNSSCYANYKPSRINMDYYYGINYESASYRVSSIDIYASASGDGLIFNAFCGGHLCIGGTLYQNCYSDCRYKENVTAIESALDKIDAINGVEFDWNELGQKETHKEGHDVGVIAQDVQSVYPIAVREVSKEKGDKVSTALVVDYEKLIPLLLQGIKELRQEINDIKQQINGGSI